MSVEPTPPVLAAVPDTAAMAPGLLPAIQSAADAAALERAAAGLLPAVRQALQQGLPALDAVRLVSHVNDAVCAAVLDRLLPAAGLDPGRACWLVMGSQARGEQTLVTDQDNAWVLADGMDDAERERWRAVGEQTNQELASCGVPLCGGLIMAGQPACCLTVSEWCGYFDRWMDRAGAAELLSARIYFDLRGHHGNLQLAAVLRDHIRQGVLARPGFLARMARNVLANRVALTWWGGLATMVVDGQRVFDLKRSGTQVVVDAARLYALSTGSTALGTVQRLNAAAPALRVPASELQDWLHGFAGLNALRLQIQLAAPDATVGVLNRVPLDRLGPNQRDALKRSLRSARVLQRRVALDWPGG
ncbi:MAG: DUF294 nucleotidyltransferase-like domain-containing protein [Aquabacterium sp.]